MKGLVITPEGKITIEEFTGSLYKALSARVGKILGIIRPHQNLRKDRVMITTFSKLEDLPENPLASYIAGRTERPIIGTVVIMKEGPTDDGIDFVDFDDEELSRLELYLTELHHIINKTLS